MKRLEGGEHAKKKKLKDFVLETIFLVIAVMCLFTAASVASQQTTARVLEGQGTVQSPLRIEVTGEVGLLGLVDSLLPFRGLPSVQIVYKDLSFPILGVNEYFIGRPWLAFWCLVSSVLAVFWLGLSLVLKLFGKRLAVVRR